MIVPHQPAEKSRTPMVASPVSPDLEWSIEATQTMLARATVEHDRPAAAVANAPHLGRPLRPDGLMR